MSTQRKLDHYFTITPVTSKQKTCFIYDPEHASAYFTSNPMKNDKYVTKKVGVSLYYRTPIKKHMYPIPQMRTSASIPLLKSNLQKAIRRGLIHEALQSSLAMIQIDSIEFLRRLPIIYIEDVCLQDSYPIVIWLMMAEKEHTIDSMDIDLLLRIVKYLCDCSQWYDNSSNYITSDLIIEPAILEHNNSLLALYYRSLYGGMKCDMLMLQNAIYYYLAHSNTITHTLLDEMDYDNIGSSVEILQESIDFHPFPGLLSRLTKKTGLAEQSIKTVIWFVESAVNVRKSYTYEEHNKYKSDSVWKIISPYLPSMRRMFYSN